MLLWIWTRNDQSGLLDDEFRDNDVDHAAADSFEPSIGLQEKKSWLIIKVPDPPLLSTFLAEIPRPEYAVGPTPDEPAIRRARRFRVDWRTKFSASEIASIEDATQMLPDGTTNGGGTVTSGVVSGLFTVSDLIRK